MAVSATARVPTVTPKTVTTPTATPATPSLGGATPATTLNPAYQTAVPNATASTIGGIPQVNAQSIMNSVGPTGYTAAQSNVDTSADSFTQAIMAAAQPGDAQAQQALNEQLANAGVIGGGAVGAQEQLSLQEAAALQGNLQSGLLSLKGDELSQAQANAASQNAASQFGITNRIGVASQDATNNLTAQADNQQTALTTAEQNQTSYNNTNQFNVANAIKAAQGNDATYNAFLQNAQQNANTDWLARLNAQTSIDTNGQTTQSQAFAPVYAQPGAQTVDFSSLGASAAPTSTAAPVAINGGQDTGVTTGYYGRGGT